MTFMRLNGFRIPVGIRRTASKKITAVGELDPQWNNRPSRSRRSLENSWTMKTAKLDQLCADTVEGLLENYGHHMPFVEDVWSTAGLRPNIGSGWSLSSTLGPLATRGHCVTVVGNLTYDTELIDFATSPDGGRWTVALWVFTGGKWERHIKRNDGTGFIDGVSDNSAGSVVTVSQGAVVISNGAVIADLVVLPFYVCDDFAPDDYAWVSGRNLAYRYTLDETYADDIQGITSTPLNIVNFGNGKVGRCALFNGTSDAINVDDAFLSSLDGLDAATFSAWVYFDALPTGGNREYVVHGTINAGSEEKFSVRVAAGGFVEVSASLTPGDNNGTTSTTGLVANKWQLLSVSMSPATGIISIYIDNLLVGFDDGGWSGSTWAGGVDAGSTYFARDTAGTASSFLDGRLDEVRLFHRALSTDGLDEIFLCERFGKRYPGPRFSADCPRVDVWGDFNGCGEVIRAFGEVTDEDVVQHGPGPADTGWTNNAREIAFTLEEEKRSPSVDSPPRPSFSWAFNRSGNRTPENNSTNLKATAGVAQLDGQGGNFPYEDRDVLGPFNFPLSAYRFDGTKWFRNNSSLVPSRAGGASSMSAAVWVKFSTISVLTFVLDITLVATTTSRLAIYLDPSNVITVGGRSDSVDAFQSVNTNHVVTADEWALVGVDLDFENDEVRVYVNGVLDNTAAVAFNSSRASAEGAAPTALAAQADGTDLLNGCLASASVWMRSLTAGEHAKIYDLGKQGRFN